MPILPSRNQISGRGRTVIGSRPAARLNDVFGMLIALFTFLAPIPVASHRPVFWLMWAAVIAVTLAFHQILTWRVESDRTQRLTQHKWVIGAALVLIGFSVLQVVPLGETSKLSNPALAATDVISIAVPQSVLGIVRFATYLMLFILVVETATNGQRVRRIGWAIYAGIVAHALWGLIALSLFKEGNPFAAGDSNALVATGTFINRNSFATYLGMGLCLGAALILNDGLKPRMRRPFRRVLDAERLERLVLWLTIVFVFYALLRTESRMGLAASLSGLFVIVLLLRQKAVGLWIALLQAMAALIAGPLLATLVFGQAVLNRSILSEVSLDVRMELYRQTVSMIRERPLTGWGLDSFATAFPLFHRPPLSSGVTWDLAHNSYLMLWAELGLIAGSIPVLILTGVSIGLLRRALRRSSHFVLPVAAFGAICVGAVHSFVDFSLEIEANTLLIVVFAGLGLANLRSTKAAE